MRKDERWGGGGMRRGGSDLGGETYLLLVRWRESFKAVEVSLCGGKNKAGKETNKVFYTSPQTHTRSRIQVHAHSHLTADVLLGLFT